MLKSKKINIVLLFAIIVLLLYVFCIEYMAMKHNNGVVSYPLDDTYIHMEVAKNLAIHGNWGINKFEFGSASSSLLYSMLLALFFLFSVNAFVPLIINCIAGVMLLVVIDKWLRRQYISDTARLIIHAAIIILLPLPVIVITGMEHTLQCLFCFLFIYEFADWLELKAKSTTDVKFPLKLFIYSMLVTTIRFEGIFLVAIICLILLFKRKVGVAFLLGGIALLPIIFFGIYSVSKGSYFLPNSVLLKSDSFVLSITGVLNFIKILFIQKLTVINAVTGLPGEFRPGISLLATQQLLVIIPLVYLLFRKNLRQTTAYGWTMLIVFVCTVLHLTFAQTGWFYRYEAYLILCTTPVVSVILVKYGGQLFEEKAFIGKLAASVLGFALFFPIIFRSAAAIAKPVRASINIHEQQYQMAMFAHKYYDNEILAFNDVGAVSFFTEAQNLDLWGLGSIEIARSKKGKYCTPDFIDSISKAKNVKIAIVYDSWFSDTLLHRWTKIATWQIQGNVICGSDIVSFYAVDQSANNDLRKNLESFQPFLPPTVRVRYY